MKYLTGIVIVCGLAAAASAEPLLTFGYTDLGGSFATGSSTFSANAVDAGDLHTAGDVTRLAGAGGTANFDDGFIGRSAFAGVGLSLTVTPIDANSASGNGQIVLTDNDGDSIQGVVTGQFSNGGFGIYYFTGYLSDVTLSGTTFDGTDGGSFGMDLPGSEPYEGALVQLFIHGASNFFSSDFSGASVQISGLVVPAPSAAGLLIAGGLLGSRRRR